MEHTFWKDGVYEGRGGIFVRNDLKKFFSTLQEKGLNPVGIKVDTESFNMEIIVENNEACKLLYENKPEVMPLQPETLQLPSAYQIGDSVFINFWSHSLIGEVCGVHFYSGKVKYDLMLFGGNGDETRIYNVDSVFVSKEKN